MKSILPKISNLKLTPRFWVFCALIVTTLACATNAPVARVSNARPTRTPLPTFTNTPLPPTATPLPTSTDTPIPTNTPDIPPTPTFTDTPLPPTDTPVPTNTPLPPTLPPPPPPTATPVPPTPTPVPVANSPVQQPTVVVNTPIPVSPAGRYKPVQIEKKANCAHIGVLGAVRLGPDDDDDPVANVTIEVTGDTDGYRGPYYGTTASDGKYTIVIGEFKQVKDLEFKAEVYGADTDNEPEWSVSDNCHDDNSVQIVEIDWVYDEDD